MNSTVQSFGTPALRVTPVPQAVKNRIALDKAAAKEARQVAAYKDLARMMRQRPGTTR